LAPEDERELAEQGWADEVRTFESGSLHDLKTISESVGDTLSKVKVSLGFRPGSVFGMRPLRPLTLHLRIDIQLWSRNPDRARQFVSVVDASMCLARLRSVLTDREL
jgi:hypothetical protein